MLSFYAEINSEPIILNDWLKLLSINGFLNYLSDTITVKSTTVPLLKLELMWRSPSSEIQSSLAVARPIPTPFLNWDYWSFKKLLPSFYNYFLVRPSPELNTSVFRRPNLIPLNSYYD